MPLSDRCSSSRIGSISVEIEKRSAMLSAYTIVKMASTNQRSRGEAALVGLSVIKCRMGVVQPAAFCGGWTGLDNAGAALRPRSARTYCLVVRDDNRGQM